MKTSAPKYFHRGRMVLVKFRRTRLLGEIIETGTFLDRGQKVRIAASSGTVWEGRADYLVPAKWWHWLLPWVRR